MIGTTVEGDAAVATATGPAVAAEPVATSADDTTEDDDDDDDDDEETDDAGGKVCAFNCHFSVGTAW